MSLHAISRSLCTVITVISLLSFRDASVLTREMGSPGAGDLTLSYSIEIHAGKRSGGKAETYNGGSKTLFISDRGIRLRLVSLMRTQSLFILPGADSNRKAALIKESGKAKYKYYLSAKNWEQFNRKYQGAACSLTGETAVILDYPCHKAVIELKKGNPITVYYTTALRNGGLSLAEPVFSCIPGLVMKYEYSYKKRTITYTVTRIDHGPINAGVFSVPSAGYSLKEWAPVKSGGS